MKTKWKVVIAIFVVAAGITSYKLYDAYVNYRFKEISKGKVYKSGVIPPDEIADFVAKHKIKSIVDLRGPVTKDKINNPENWKEINAEKAAVEKIPGLNYYNIPSEQVPKKENLNAFYKVIDNPDNYPILIHCYHGIGRAQLYSAVYLMEREGFTNEDAHNEGVIPFYCPLDQGTSKGDFLEHYVTRRDSVKLTAKGKSQK